MSAPVMPPALAAMRRSLDEALRLQTVAQVLSRKALEAHFQPIVELKNGNVMGHESLIRGPAGSPLRSPDALFQAARVEHLSVELEQASLLPGLRTWELRAQEKRLVPAGTGARGVFRADGH